MQWITGPVVTPRFHYLWAVLLLGLSLSLTWPRGADSFSVSGYDEGQEEELEPGLDNGDQSAADQYVTMLKRYYRGWGHSRRFPWKRLPHEMCFRQPCKRNRDCCYRWNICDKSAKVCVDCWYGSSCRSEQDCCSRYPYCARIWKKSREGNRYIVSGKCVRKL